MTQRTLRADLYPSRLSDADLDVIEELAFRSWDQCPKFCDWLVEEIQGEKVRRLEHKPVRRFAVPVSWSGRMLAEALTTVTAMTYFPPSYAVGQFADSLLATVNALAATKLESIR